MTGPLIIATPADIPRLLDARRYELGYTVNRLSLRVDTSYTHVSKILTGKVQPMPEVLLRLTEALRCDLALIPREDA
jgi:transcriptional regulator with XRE-family HTH domain